MRRFEQPTRPGRASAPRGFTIMEILVVVAVIILLLSVLIVAVGQAAERAQAANTQVLMTSLRQGLVRFEEDIGYYPPILGSDLPSIAGDLRSLRPSPDPDAPAYRDQVQRWHSVTSLAEYLLGYGHHYQDGYGTVPGADPIRDWEAETPPLGIRNPGRDGVWGAATNRGASGTLADRMYQGLGQMNSFQGSETAPYAIDQGQVFGPYIELKDDRLLGSVSGQDAQGNPIVSFPGESGYDPSHPKVIVDYWGRPIRYYRRVYPTGALNQGYRPGQASRVPTLSDVFLLRPFDIPVGSAVDNAWADDSNWGGGMGGGGGDTSTTYERNAAAFALFSSGPDRAFDQTARVDEAEFNRDNIVEVGP